MIRFFQISHCAPDIICIQELWQFPDLLAFTIPGSENLLCKLRRNNVQGGGVDIYAVVGKLLS
jgi:hypothetical protein